MFPLASNTDESAISRVLEVTELLESILKFLPFARLVRPGAWGRIYVMRPQALYEVQRVNQKFKETVKGSPTLKRLMFLEPVADDSVFRSEADGPQGRDPLNWFASRADETLGLNLRRRTSFHDTGTHSYWSVFVIKQSTPECWQREEASWRRMRISRESSGGRINISFAADWHRQTKGTTDFPLSERFWVRYAEPRRFAESASLGDVFDTSLQIQSRDVFEHAQAMADIIAEEGLLD